MIWRVVSRETSIALYDHDDNQAPPGTLAAQYGYANSVEEQRSIKRGHRANEGKSAAQIQPTA
jgi:hypothetical protein